jgi:RIO-like serine/threonine protein kinase
MDDYKLISVTLKSTNKLEIYNPTNLQLIGQGGQGAVFKIDDNKCVKIYESESIANKEKISYQRTLGSPIVPLFYEAGPNYIIMEYINGPNMKDYLLEKGIMTPEITKELITMFNEMNRLGFLRKDESLRHILLKDSMKLKIVDHVYAFSLRNPVPVKLFKQLDAIGMLNTFIEQGFTLAPELFKEFSKKMPEYFNVKNETGGKPV